VKCIRHVEHEEQPVAKTLFESRSSAARSWSQVRTVLSTSRRLPHLHQTCRIFRKVVLIDRLRKDSPHVRANLQHSILGMGFGQLIELILQDVLVEPLQSYISNGTIRSAVMMSFFTLAVSSRQSASFSGK